MRDRRSEVEGDLTFDQAALQRAERFDGTELAAGRSNEPSHSQRPVEVAVVNLMPDAAFLDTEAQFLGLLSQAANGLGVELRARLFWLGAVRRSPAVVERIARSYLRVEALRHGPVDALIVTGTEPKGARIEEEAFWPVLADLIEWSADNVPSVILSCLSAHAAAKVFDGVERKILPQKLSGVFETLPNSSRILAQGLPSKVWLPHSRCNDIPTSVLESHGYLPVLRSGETWTAMETARSRAWFLLFQGHPEYAPNSLLREFRRDVRRYLTGERPLYPNVPDGYVDGAGLRLLNDFADLPSTTVGNVSGIEAFPAGIVEGHFLRSWDDPARILYQNWLSQVLDRRDQPADTTTVESFPDREMEIVNA